MIKKNIIATLAIAISTTPIFLNCNTVKKNILDPVLKIVFEETQTTRVISDGKYPADIAYIFADIKYQDGKIKICEFGNGIRASVASSEVPYNGKTVEIDTPYWPIFWPYIQQLNKPIWVVGKKNKTVPSKKIIRVTDIDMIPVADTQKTFAGVPKKRPKSIDTCQGIVVYQYLDTRNPARAKKLEDFQNNHPEFLVINRSAIRFAYNKLYSAQLLDTPKLRNLKPQWKQYRKKYTPTLAQKILRDIKSNVVVIKPINSRQAQGIIMVEAANLDITLQALFSSPSAETTNIPDQRDAAAFAYWKTDKNKVFMVESCESSKLINIRGDWYNPTMRLVFILRHEAGQINTNIIGGYWKIPPKPVSDQTASLTEKFKTIPMHHVVSGYTGLKIDEIDFIQAKAIMYNVLPEIYERMLMFTATTTSNS